MDLTNYPSEYAHLPKEQIPRTEEKPPTPRRAIRDPQLLEQTGPVQSGAGTHHTDITGVPRIDHSSGQLNYSI